MSGSESSSEKTFSAAAAERVNDVMRPCRFWYAEFIMFQYSWNVMRLPTETPLRPSSTSSPPYLR